MLGIITFKVTYNLKIEQFSIFIWYLGYFMQDFKKKLKKFAGEHQNKQLGKKHLFVFPW